MKVTLKTFDQCHKYIFNLNNKNGKFPSDADELRCLISSAI